METEVGWKMGGRKRRGGGREGKKRKTFLRPCSAETRFQGIATLLRMRSGGASAPLPLAVLRPVFRGLRPAHRRAALTTARQLAVLRPVFRGLRHVLRPPRDERQEIDNLQC